MVQKFQCAFQKRGNISCSQNANYILHANGQKYCLRHLISMYNIEKSSIDPEFTKSKCLSEIEGYSKIDYKNQLEIPEVSEVSDVSEVSSQLEVEAPETLEVSDVSEVLEVSNQFETEAPEVSEILDVSEVLNQLELSDVSEVLNQLQVPEISEVLNQLEAEVPEVSEVLNQLEAEVSEVSEVLNQIETQISEVSEVSNNMEVSDNVEVSNQCILVRTNMCKYKGKALYVHTSSNDVLCRAHLLQRINASLSIPKINLRECKGLYKPCVKSSSILMVKTVDTEEVITTILNELNSKKTIFEFKGLLGKGAFGTVYHIVHIPSSISYAMKLAVFDSSNKKRSKLEMDMIHSEYLGIICLQSTPTDGIVNLIDHHITNPYGYKEREYTYIILEKYYMTLYDAVVQKKIKITKEWICSIGSQLLDIIKYIHRSGRLYIDLKPENIMFRDSNLKQIVLIDFGIYKRWKDPRGDVKEQVDVKEIEGTPLYASKNALSNKSTSRIDDIESIGYILIFLYHEGAIPWEREKSNAAILKRKSEICYSSDGECLPEYITTFIEETQNYHFQEMPVYLTFHYILNPPSYITMLPTYRYQKKCEEEEKKNNDTEYIGKDMCIICRMDFKESEDIRALPCLHIYHRRCIDKWIIKKRVCPTCKYSI